MNHIVTDTAPSFGPPFVMQLTLSKTPIFLSAGDTLNKVRGLGFFPE